MAKRTNSSDDVPPTKRIRKAPGFRLARSAPIPSESNKSNSSTSLFVTVNPSDERRGTLQAQNRVLATSHGPSTSGSSLPSSLEAQPLQAFEPNTEIQDEPIAQLEDEQLEEPQPQETVKPKRKRNTTNAVCCPPNFSRLK